MEDKIVKVKVKDVAQSPLKLRLVADAVRGKSVPEALDILTLLNKKGADTIRKAIQSGIANAREIYNVDEESLEVSKITVDEARTLKRTRFASRGRVSVIIKRRSHINLELKVK
jgi:large subunit ribosomal protein L22